MPISSRKATISFCDDLYHQHMKRIFWENFTAKAYRIGFNLVQRRHSGCFNVIPVLLLACLSTAACSPANNISTASGTASSTTAEVETAYRYLESQKSGTGLSAPRSQLELIDSHPDTLGNQHVKFRQVVKGIPVWGRQLIVHITQDGHVYRIDGDITKGLDDFDITPQLNAADAIDNVKAAIEREGMEEPLEFGPPELQILTAKKPTLVYVIEVMTGLRRDWLLIDANNGKILKRVSGTPPSALK